VDRAPVASIERVRAYEVESARDRTSVAVREQQQDLVAHALGDEIEELARQIGVAPFARAGVLVENPHRVPFGAADLGSAKRSKADPVASGRALLADRLALAAGQVSEEVVEAGIAA